MRNRLDFPRLLSEKTQPDALFNFISKLCSTS